MTCDQLYRKLTTQATNRGLILTPVSTDPVPVTENGRSLVLAATSFYLTDPLSLVTVEVTALYTPENDQRFDSIYWRTTNRHTITTTRQIHSTMAQLFPGL